MKLENNIGWCDATTNQHLDSHPSLEKRNGDEAMSAIIVPDKGSAKIPVRRAAHRCVDHRCDSANLIWMNPNNALQTRNGFLIANVAGWYCPNCASSYGGTKT